MKKTTTIVVSLLVFSSLAIPLVVLNACNQRHSDVERATLRLQWLHQAQFAGFYTAKEKGFYRDLNIDLDIRQGGKGYNVPVLVSEEREDFGIWVGNSVLSSFDKQDLAIRAVGTVFNRSLACFMVKEESSIHTPSDFRGKTVGMYPGFDTETIYIELMKRFGIDRSEVKEVPANYSIAPFLDGQVDIWPSFVINEPLDAEKHGVKVRVLSPDVFGIKFYSDTLIVNEKTLRERRSLVLRFLEASEKGWRYALSHPDEAVEYVLKYDPKLDRNHERKMLEAMSSYLNTTDPLFKMSPDVWQSMASVLQGQGALTNSESYKRLCDFEIAQEAHNNLHDK
jgi:NitT/TauT family transport system substrate-binding protein